MTGQAPVQVKICGLSTIETVDAALTHGASHIGLVFFERSPRHVPIDLAARLAARASGRAKVVGLFVDAPHDWVDQVRRAVPLDVLQLHGAESPAEVAHLAAQTGLETWKALPVRVADDVRSSRHYDGIAARILFDAKPPPGAALPGGNGLRFDWGLLRGAPLPSHWALSGGLDPRNVGEAIATTSATMVDASSGIESAPGVKDVDKIAAFLKAARS